MPSPETTPDIFVTTRWTAVLTAGCSDTARARQALAELCQAYWFPLYAYARRRGHGPHDAEDLTQGFFARLLKMQSLAGVSREKGKFRAFLLASMNHYLADEWDRACAQKRDIHRTISLDAEAAENRYRAEPVEHLTPERLFDRQWALTLLEAVVQRLHREYEESGRGALFLELRFAITGEKSDVPYADLAARLGLTGEAVRVAVHRLRQRFRKLLWEEIGQTVADESEIADEMRNLRQILSS
jgi:RNA polymerase sigma-70 factor (ECF subfamily)